MGRLGRWRHAAAMRQWWQDREVRSAELTAMLADLAATGVPPGACADALGRLSRFDPLFEDCPDPELHTLNQLRRAALRRALHAGSTGDHERAVEHLDEFNDLTRASIERVGRLYR